jgi:hypothetical protein
MIEELSFHFSCVFSSINLLIRHFSFAKRFNCRIISLKDRMRYDIAFYIFYLLNYSTIDVDSDIELEKEFIGRMRE